MNKLVTLQSFHNVRISQLLKNIHIIKNKKQHTFKVRHL